MSGGDRRALIESELLRQRIRLYLYGELGLAERIEIERCKDEDPAFRALFDEEREFLLALGDGGIGSDMDSLLEECRYGLDLAITDLPRPRRRFSPGLRVRSAVRDLSRLFSARPLAWQAATAALMLAAGFLAGRGLESGPGLPTLGSQRSAGGQFVSSDADRTLTGIETVRLDPVGGQVQIVVEERTVISGRSSDPAIRDILLDSVHQSHAGARLTSLDALREHAAETEVREALLRTMLEDEDLGVRLKALEAVQDFAGRPDVRQALVKTLLQDPSAGMRGHAIQLLREHADRDMAGPLQELIERESDPFVIRESEEILDSLGASMERF